MPKPPQVFQGKGDVERATACNDMVVKIWSSVLCRVVLGVVQVRIIAITTLSLSD